MICANLRCCASTSIVQQTPSVFINDYTGVTVDTQGISEWYIRLHSSINKHYAGLYQYMLLSVGYYDMK